MTESDQSNTPTSESGHLPSELEQLLKKYIAVWLWSILFGGTTGLSYTMLSLYSGERWGPLGVVLGASMALAMLFLTMAWFYLYVYLRDFLIPDALIGRQKGELVDHLRGGEILQRAYLLMIVSGVVGILIRVLQFLLQSLI